MRIFGRKLFGQTNPRTPMNIQQIKAEIDKIPTPERSSVITIVRPNGIYMDIVVGGSHIHSKENKDGKLELASSPLVPYTMASFMKLEDMAADDWSIAV